MGTRSVGLRNCLRVCLIREFFRVSWILVLSRLFETHGLESTIGAIRKGPEPYHPVQQGFWEKHGMQCGFCTPGIVMSVVELLERNPDPTEEEISDVLGGHLCRCTGYHKIVEAVEWAAALERGEVTADEYDRWVRPEDMVG